MIYVRQNVQSIQYVLNSENFIFQLLGKAASVHQHLSRTKRLSSGISQSSLQWLFAFCCPIAIMHVFKRSKRNLILRKLTILVEFSHLFKRNRTFCHSPGQPVSVFPHT